MARPAPKRYQAIQDEVDLMQEDLEADRQELSFYDSENENESMAKSMTDDFFFGYDFNFEEDDSENDSYFDEGDGDDFVIEALEGFSLIPSTTSS